MLELHEGSLNIPSIQNRWYNAVTEKNFGAFITFVGIVRKEDGIEALSFDIHKPMLQSWFRNWSSRASHEGAEVLMAHSIGDVKVYESSYIAAVCSPQRKVALRLIGEFVEDFKANAPIWKYDVINGKRVYAKERSHPIEGSGLLGGIE